MNNINDNTERINVKKQNIRKPWNCLTRYVLFQVQSYTIIIKNIGISQSLFPSLEYSTRLIYKDRGFNCTITVGSHLNLEISTNQINS